MRLETSSPMSIRSLSSFCHWPSRARRAPISKYPVATSNVWARSAHSLR